MDAGLEVSWVPATSKAGDDVRSTFVLAAAQFRPWESRGFFLQGRHGHGLRPQLRLRRDRHAAADHVEGAGTDLWRRLGVPPHRATWAFEMFGAQHVAALGDFQTGGVTVENVIGNFWSVGAAIVIR